MLHLQGYSKIKIAEELGKLRQWVHTWIKWYHTIGGDDWYKTMSRSPIKVKSKTFEKVEVNLTCNICRSVQLKFVLDRGWVCLFLKIRIAPQAESYVNQKRRDGE